MSFIAASVLSQLGRPDPSTDDLPGQLGRPDPPTDDLPGHLGRPDPPTDDLRGHLGRPDPPTGDLPGPPGRPDPLTDQFSDQIYDQSSCSKFLPIHASQVHQTISPSHSATVLWRVRSSIYMFSFLICVFIFYCVCSFLVQCVCVYLLGAKLEWSPPVRIRMDF